MASDGEIRSNPLGQPVGYQSEYQADLLFPIERNEKRDELGLSGKLPFVGQDIWNAYELSWLNPKGLPQVGIGEVFFNAYSPKIIESKSLKLYLNSLNQKRFSNIEEVAQTIQNDLSIASESEVIVSIKPVEQNSSHMVSSISATCIDEQDISIDSFNYQPELLQLENSLQQELIVAESLCSHLLKSNCLITNQPDWASIYIEYKGAKIDRSGLLKYIVSFRNHNEFHEQCVERIFCDILRICQPQELTVNARYTRRGGLDINPWRSSHNKVVANKRLVRQ